MIPEYFEWENNSIDQKHEYYKGEIPAMTGAKVPHNTITTNFLCLLGMPSKENHVALSTATKEFIYLRTRCLHTPISPLYVAK